MAYGALPEADTLCASNAGSQAAAGTGANRCDGIGPAADFESTYLTARAKGIPVKQIDTPVLSIVELTSKDPLEYGK